jgi:thiol-disulfide isomerase/thioredoxin
MSGQSGPETAKNGGSTAPRSWAVAAGLAVAAIGVIGLLYVLFAASSKPDQAGYARFAQGPLARLAVLKAPPPQPLAELRDSEGRALTLETAKGEIVLLNIWATWCSPCIQEMPTLAALQQRFDGKGLHVMAVSVDGVDDRDKAKQMLAQLSHGALDFYVDPAQSLAFDVGAPGMPTSILYDRAGHERARLSGSADWSSPQAAALIEAALAER